MPDRRRHRGPHPADPELFAPEWIPTLRRAVAELSWLLGRGYPEGAALALVGDHHQLRDRQRTAVQRSAAPPAAVADRRSRRLDLCDCSGRRLAVDGFNLLITIESALSGAVLLVGADGCLRDLASVWGSYRRIEETREALERILATLSHHGIDEVRFLLDRPVSNSGRLKSLLAELLPPVNRWSIELVDHADPEVAGADAVAASSDSWVLDHCGPWTNLAASVVAGVRGTWVVDLGGEAGPR